MPPDPVRVADTKAWLDKARLDLRSVRADLAVDPPILGDAAFHCQQAVEKALKALLTRHDVPFRKTHDLADLGARCATLAPDLAPLFREAAPLTEYAWQYRYPGEATEPSGAEVAAAMAAAERVVAAIEEAVALDVGL